MLKFNSIYQGDCLELMKHIPDGSIDLICTDPPYCVGATSNGLKSSYSDLSLIKPFFNEVFQQWQRVLKDGGHAYCFTDWRTYPLLYGVMQKSLTVRNLIVWNHKLLRPGNWYRYSYELVIFATKGKAERNFGGSERDIIEIKPATDEMCPNRLHSSQKPLELLEKLITNSTVEGDKVLDCFIGSGSTAVAAINTGRQFIGFELDEHYFDVACDRIVEAENKKNAEQEILSA